MLDIRLYRIFSFQQRSPDVNEDKDYVFSELGRASGIVAVQCIAVQENVGVHVLR